MKRTAGIKMIVGSVALSLGLGLASWAQCTELIPVSNGFEGGQHGLYGQVDDGSGSGSIVTAFWLFGAGGAANSGALPSNQMVKQWESFRYSPVNTYSVSTSWGLSATVGCPTMGSRTAFVYSIENGGKGQYIVMTAASATTFRSGGASVGGPVFFDYDNISNGNAGIALSDIVPVDIPNATAEALVKIDEYMTELPLALTWEPIAGLRGFYDSDPGRNVVTGMVILYHQGAPENNRTDSWSVAQGGMLTYGNSGLDPGSATVTVPVTPGVETYIALTPVFDDFVAATFVGPLSVVYSFNPSGPPLPIVSPPNTYPRPRLDPSGAVSPSGLPLVSNLDPLPTEPYALVSDPDLAVAREKGLRKATSPR